MSLHPSFARVARSAARQFGLFTRRQADRCGMTDRMLRQAVAAGIYERIARGVFRVAGSPESWEQRLLGACYAGGPDSLASHRAAAALHGFDGIVPGVIEVLVPQRVWYRREDIVVHHTSFLPVSHRCTVGPIPATTPARTIHDLGAIARIERVEEAFDGAERDGRITEAGVRDCYEGVRARGRNGTGPMGAVLERRSLLTGVPQSVLERRMLRLLERHGLPLPVCQHAVRRRDGTMAILDFAYVLVMLAIEVDGHRSHATRLRRAADYARTNNLPDWQILRFSYEQVLFEEEAVAATVRRALAERDVSSPI